MTKRTATILAGSGFAGFLACNIGGVRVAFDNPENLGSQVMERLSANHTETKSLITRAGERIGATETALGEVKSRLGEFDARIADAEQKAARRGGGGGGGGPLQVKSLGQRFVESEQFKATEGNRDRAGNRVSVTIGGDPLQLKAITSVTGSGASLIAPDNRVNDPALLPWATNSVRSLVAPGQTSSNAVWYPRMTGRTNAAAPQSAEGALKSQSDMTFESVMAPVTVIAHWFLLSKQILEDSPALAATLDFEARAGLRAAEDGQLLFGDGTGANLHGLVPQAATFVKQWSVANGTALDVLIQAIAQVESQDFICDGICLNSVDWRQLQSSKDQMGRFIGNSPFDVEVLKRIWSTPVVTSNRIPRGKALVGPFSTQAQIFDRAEIDVQLSSEDRDNWVRNMVTALCESRLAFTVKRPSSFVYCDLGTSLAA